LFWADISAGRLWMHDTRNSRSRHWDLPAPLGCIGLCADGRLLLGLAKGLYLADPDGSAANLALCHVVAVEAHSAHTRINDGRSDRHGNFVFGTKDESAHASPGGSFYQYSFRHGLRRLALPHAVIPNSICFSRDGHTLYFCDSVVPEIHCCSYEPQAATVTDERVFARVDAPGASPDGSVIDAEGCLWNAQWGGARVVGYFPDGGVRATVSIPVKNPSCCAFGGAALDRLYVTTAREEMSGAELEAAPHAGGVYCMLSAGAKGLLENRVALS
jgi:sugar lactone lactonase YvrE